MRRVVFYLFFDPQGRVDDFVDYKLRALRKHADHIFVVSNSALDAANRAKLEKVADTVWVRENVGFDVWAYKEAMKVFGADRLSEYDELILMNYTFFGPIGSFDRVFAETESRPEIDFWGISEHDEVRPHPFADAEVMEAHIQSHWIGARKSLFTSSEWAAYWDDMPMISSYSASVNRHESRFTKHFVDAGFKPLVLWPASDYPSRHPIMDNAAMMLRDGCPIVKRRSFFHDPLYNDRMGVDGREILRIIESAGYPMDLAYSNLVRTAPPRWLATNLALLEVLPEVEVAYDAGRPQRIAAVVHVYYADMTDEILDRLAMLPGAFDLFITTTDLKRKHSIDEVLERRGVTGDVRVVERNRGRDISAFFIGCRDVIESDDYDLIVKLHSKRSPQDTGNLGTYFKRHLFENLLSSSGYTANLLGLFQRHASLGMVFPPVIHVGYPTLGHAWFANKEGALREADRLGIKIPFDESTPLAAYGSMFVARPQALRRIAAAGYSYDDFPGEADYSDGALSHILERLVSYASMSEGLHVRQVMNADNVAVSYSYLEFKHQALAAELGGYAAEQIAQVRTLKRRVLKLQRRLEEQADPGAASRARARLGRTARRVKRVVSAARGPVE